jgi:hypothetical protein
MVRLAAPNGGIPSSITTPAMWGVEELSGGYTDGGCPGGFPGPPGAHALAGTGTVDFDAGFNPPTEADIFVRLTFAPSTFIDLRASRITQCQ